MICTSRTMIYGDDDDGGGDEDICLTLNVRIVMTMPLYGSIISRGFLRGFFDVRTPTERAWPLSFLLVVRHSCSKCMTGLIESIYQALWFRKIRKRCKKIYFTANPTMQYCTHSRSRVVLLRKWMVQHGSQKESNNENSHNAKRIILLLKSS